MGKKMSIKPSQEHSFRGTHNWRPEKRGRNINKAKEGWTIKRC